ncbi:MAG: hypothetical protein Q4G28_01275 [Neisseria sp.]|nr:hypothetical protein [Neisseria sp.]
MKKLIPFIILTALSACANLSDGQTVQVYQSDGSRQCEGAGVSPEEMQRELDGIRVYAAEKSHLQGVAFPAVCGGATGSINVYTIDAAEQEEAAKRGFNLLNQKAF